MSDLIFFNSSDGFSEAFLRGLRKSILTESNYGVMSSTNNLRDLKIVKNYLTQIERLFKYLILYSYLLILE